MRLTGSRPEIERIRERCLPLETVSISKAYQRRGDPLVSVYIECSTADFYKYFIQINQPGPVRLFYAIYTSRTGAGDLLIVNLPENYLTMADFEGLEYPVLQYGEDSFRIRGMELARTPEGKIDETVIFKVSKIRPGKSITT